MFFIIADYGDTIVSLLYEEILYILVLYDPPWIGCRVWLVTIISARYSIVTPPRDRSGWCKHMNETYQYRVIKILCKEFKVNFISWKFILFHYVSMSNRIIQPTNSVLSLLISASEYSTGRYYKVQVPGMEICVYAIIHNIFY